MQKLVSTIKLPRIEDPNIKSQPYFAPKDMIPPFRLSPKAENKAEKNRSPLLKEDELPTNSLKRGFPNEKGPEFEETREGIFFSSPAQKHNRYLKKIEGRGESFPKKAQFIGLRENPLNRINQLPTEETNEKDSISMRRKAALQNSSVSKSVNLGNGKTGRAGSLPDQVESHRNMKKRIEMRLEDDLDNPPNVIDFQNRLTPTEGLLNSSSKYERGKGPLLTPIEDKLLSDSEQFDTKVNFELMFKIYEAFRGIYEDIENRSSVTAKAKEYLESITTEEVVQVEVDKILEILFFDTRMRRNLKTYLMLEKTSVFILLFLLNEDASGSNIHKICHYMYCNFLNFMDCITTKLEMHQQFTQVNFSVAPSDSGKSPQVEKMRQICKSRPQELDRSFGLEQVNKLLMKMLKSSFKSVYKQVEQQTKMELLFEKIEFGLMLNYFTELKSIFHDLIIKTGLNIQTKNQNSNGHLETDPGLPKKKNPKLEKPKAGGSSTKFNVSDAPIKVILPAQEKEYHLPAPVPRTGREELPIYSLVLDMDETLIHFEEVGGKGRFFVRPHAEQFLKEMSEIYEIIVFTAGVQEYADAVLNILDPKKYITHRLYRHHTTLKSSVPGVIKDLSKLGRDLSKTLIIDNAPENFRLHVDNGIEISSWYNDPYDTELLDLMPFLRDMVIKQVPDVRKCIKKFKDKKKFKRH